MSKNPIPDIIPSTDVEIQPGTGVKLVVYLNNQLTIDIGSTIVEATRLSTVLDNLSKIMKDPGKNLIDIKKDDLFKDIRTGQIIDRAEALKKMGMEEDTDKGA